jgi:hypothetical protein
MVKKIVLALTLFYTIIYADSNSTRYQYKNFKEKIFNENCMVCHKQLSFNLERIFFDYLLKYSSEEAVKIALIDYLKDPNPDTSVMSKDYIRRFGVKKPTNLNDVELKMAIDYYWDRYKVFGKLK